MSNQILAISSTKYRSQADFQKEITAEKSGQIEDPDVPYVIELEGAETEPLHDSTKPSANDIEKIKKQSERATQTLRNLVEKLILKQNGKSSSFSINISIDGSTGAISSDYTPVEAQEATSEDGYWGVEAVSDRIVAFAKDISGNDPGKLSVLKEAIDKGFRMASDTLGTDLPEISMKTYDAVMKKLDDWNADLNTEAESQINA